MADIHTDILCQVISKCELPHILLLSTVCKSWNTAIRLLIDISKNKHGYCTMTTKIYSIYRNEFIPTIFVYYSRNPSWAIGRVSLKETRDIRTFSLMSKPSAAYALKIDQLPMINFMIYIKNNKIKHALTYYLAGALVVDVYTAPEYVSIPQFICTMFYIYDESESSGTLEMNHQLTSEVRKQLLDNFGTCFEVKHLESDEIVKLMTD